jgi:hypothetical protein
MVIDNWKFQAVTMDIRDINYKGHTFKVRRSDGSEGELFSKPDTIINTSCEHIENFQNWYESLPVDSLLILQSNNGYGIEGHVNCVNDLGMFMSQTPMSNVLFTGEKEMPKFTRFMRIGYK